MDKGLYLPQSWISDPDRCAAAGIPVERRQYRSKNELALELLERALQLGHLRAGWVAGDDAFGMSPSFREALAALGMRYVLDVPGNTTVWPLELAWTSPEYQGFGRPRKPRLRDGQRRTLEQRSDELPDAVWREITVAQGSQGPRTYSFSAQRVRVTRKRKPGEEVWAVWRRNLDGSEPLQALYADIPFGLPEEPLPSKEALGFRVPLYGFDTWRKLFTNRQLLSYAVLVSAIRSIPDQIKTTDVVKQCTVLYLLCVLSKQLDYCNSLCSWYTQNEQISHLFNRFALPIKWDFAESSPLGGASGSWRSMLNSVAKSIDTAVAMPRGLPNPTVSCGSASSISGQFDVIITDPPYYDAIPYSDSMDFFHVWLRRSNRGFSDDIDLSFQEPLGPKWNHETGDGELIDDASRFEGDSARSKQNYEDGMARSFQACHAGLAPEGTACGRVR